MATFLLRRLGLMVLTLFLLSLMVFIAGQILPGDPAHAILGNLAAPSAVQALDHQLGVDRPLLTRYLSWLGRLRCGGAHSVPPIRSRGLSKVSSTSAMSVATT